VRSFVACVRVYVCVCDYVRACMSVFGKGLEWGWGWRETKRYNLCHQIQPM